MSDGNDVEIRRTRLRALRERHEQSAGPASVGTQGEIVVENENEPAQLLVPIQQRAPKAEGARQQAVGLAQRVVTFLTQEGPGARFVAGTNIREDRLGQLLQFLKRRGAAANGQQAQRARSLLTYLTEAMPGERKIAGVNINRAQLLVERTGGKNPRIKEVAAIHEDDESLIEGDVLAEEVEALGSGPTGKSESQPNTIRTPAARTAVADESLQELVERARRLSEELLAVQQRICERVAGKPSVVASPEVAAPKRARPVSPVQPPEGRGEWYMDFLD
ncbi:MAG: hypothetical protein U1F42_10540 [Candidatus Competibacteraceae bacterium]